MASSSKRPTKKKGSTEEWTDVAPFQLRDIHISDHNYVGADNLNVFSTGIFTASFKNDKNEVWTVTLEPEEIKRMYNHSSSSKVFKEMRLHHYFRLRPCGVDVRRCHQLLTSLDAEGKATVENADGEMVEIKVTEDLVAESLKLPRGSQQLPQRGNPDDIKATFHLKKGQEHTFKDLKEKEVELPLRLYTQQFKHGKPVRYTQPHRVVARLFTLGLKKSTRQVTWDFAELVHRELIAYAGKTAESQKTINCGQMLTRLVYHAVGMVDKLPAATSFEEFVNQCQNPQPRAVKSPTKRKSSREKKGSRHVEEDLESSEDRALEEDEEEEGRLERRSKRAQEVAGSREESHHEEEPSSSDKEADVPAAPEVRKKWDRILKERETKLKELKERVARGEAEKAQRPPKPAKRTRDEQRAENIRLEKEREYHERKLVDDLQQEHAKKQRLDQQQEEGQQEEEHHSQQQGGDTQAEQQREGGEEEGQGEQDFDHGQRVPSPPRDLEEQRRRIEDEQRKAAEQEAKQKAEQEAKQKAEEEERQKIEEQQKKEAAEEEQRKKNEEDKQQQERQEELEREKGAMALTSIKEKGKGKKKIFVPSSSDEDDESDAEGEDDFDRAVATGPSQEWDAIELAKDVQKRMRQIVRTTKRKQEQYEDLKAHASEQNEELKAREALNTEMVQQLEVHQSKVEALEKKDAERLIELQKMTEEIKEQQGKVHNIEDKLNIETGKTMALSMQLLEKEQAMKELTKDFERRLKEKESQLAVMARAQALSNQRAITAEKTMNEFLANPLAGMAVGSSTPQDPRIDQMQKQIDQDKLFKGLMMGRLAKVTEEKDSTISELNKEFTRLKELLAEMEKQAATRVTQPQVVLPPEMPSYMQPPDFEEEGPSTPLEEVPLEEDLDYSVAGHSLKDPRETDLERQMKERIALQTNVIVRECMEWEQRVLHSACLSYLTAEDIHKDYHLPPTLPLPLLKMEV